MRSAASLQHVNGRSADASSSSRSSLPPSSHAPAAAASVLSMSSADRRLPCTLRLALGCLSGCRRWLVLPRKARWLLGGCILACGLWAFVALLPPSEWTTELPRPRWTTPAIAAAATLNPSIAAQISPAPAPSPLSPTEAAPPPPAPSPAAPEPPPVDPATARVAALSSLLSSYVPRHYGGAQLLAEGRPVLVFSVGDDGLGNKLLPLVSAFLLSLLLDRAFLLHWTGSEAVHNTPMHVEQLFSPPDGLQWSFEAAAKQALTRPGAKADQQRQLERQRLLELYNAERAVKLEEIRALFRFLPLSFAELDMRTADYGLIKERALCEDWRLLYSNVSALLVQGDQYFVPCLQANPAYRADMSRWFDHRDVYGPLARWLLRPAPPVAAYVEPFVQENFSNYTIGLQLRRRERLGLRDEEVEQALRCAVQLASAYLTGSPKPTEEQQSTAALPAVIPAPANRLPGRRVSFFIASDDQQLRPRLRTRLAALGHVAFTQEFALREDMSRGLLYAVIDSVLLGRSSDLITTPSSTFGYIAHGYASLVPYRVQLQPRKTWRRPPSSEPSAHFWQPLMREAQRLCIDKADFPELMQQEECCPRW